jgi:hypothetical protein
MECIVNFKVFKNFILVWVYFIYFQLKGLREERNLSKNGGSREICLLVRCYHKKIGFYMVMVCGV